jgi:uncharacterized protein (TIGR03437 family)
MPMVLALIGLALACADAATSQIYTVTTVAGGALPDNVPAATASAGKVARIALGPDGSLYFSVPDRNVVFRRDGAGLLTRVAGSGAYGFGGDGGPAVDAQLAYPFGVALDSAGNLYIADRDNHRIRRVSGGVITTVAGVGTPGFGGDGGPAAAAQLNRPLGVAVDAAGDLYVADSVNGRVRRISGGVITTAAGNGTAGDSGDNGPAADARFRNLVDVAVDSAGAFYVADSLAGRVRKVAGGVITTVAGTGVRGYGGDGGPAAAALLYSPYGVAVDSLGNLYIADAGDNRIRKVSGATITTLAGNGTSGYGGDGGPAGGAILNAPYGVAADGSGVYVADSGNNRLRKISDGTIATIAGDGTAGFAGDGRPARDAQFNRPSAITGDPDGSLYISDSGNHRVRKLANGIVSTAAGNGAAGFGGDGGPGAGAGLQNPQQLAAGPAGDLYIADADNHRIRKIAGGVITTVAGSGTAGYAGDGGPATGAKLNQPMGIAIDSAGDLYIADFSNNRIRKVSNGVITTVAGTGQSGFSGDGGPATSAQLNSPLGLAVDRAGDLYIADYGNHRIRKVSSGVITTVAGNGTQGGSGDGGPATGAALNSPWAVAVDPAGDLYVADYGNHRVRKISGGVITTIAGTGARGYTGDGGPALAARLDGPAGLYLAPDGTLYVADSLNHRVRAVTKTGGVFSAVSAASFTAAGPLAPGVIAAGYGTDLAPGVVIAPAAGPLPTTLAQTSVVIRDSTGTERPAPLWFVSPSQINFFVPEETALGLATAMVVRDAQIVAGGAIQIDPVAPGLFTMNANGRGVAAAIAVVARANGSQDWQYVFNSGCAPGACQPVPLNFGGEGDQLYLQLYGTGIRGRASLDAVTAAIGDMAAPVEYAGPVAGMAGLDQINLRVPRALAGRGEVDVAVTVEGKAANTVRVNIR